jgi:antirestriction protein ArdC
MSPSIARARAGRDRTSLYQETTEKIIAELEAGRVPWVQPWGTSAAKLSVSMPKNAATQRCLRLLAILPDYNTVLVLTKAWVEVE